MDLGSDDVAEIKIFFYYEKKWSRISDVYVHLIPKNILSTLEIANKYIVTNGHHVCTNSSVLRIFLGIKCT